MVGGTAGFAACNVSGRHQVGLPLSLCHQFLLLLVNDLPGGRHPASFLLPSVLPSFELLPRLLSAQLISCRRRRRLKRRTPSIISKLRAAFLSPPLLTFYCFWAELERILTGNRSKSGLRLERQAQLWFCGCFNSGI